MACNDGCFHFAATESVGEDGAIGDSVVGHQQIQVTILSIEKVEIICKIMQMIPTYQIEMS